jgi:drug/metabolite transporter (DMT)-like permease
VFPLPTVHSLGWVFVSFGRAVIAGGLAAIVLAVTRTPLPPRELLRRFAAIIGGVVLGFPAMTGLALRHAPAGHGAVVIGLLPAATAGWSLLRSGERPSRRYWVFAFLGVAAVTFLAVARAGTKDVAVGDLLLVGAVLLAAVGYTEGAHVSRTIGGWQTISWAVVFALPLTLVLTILGVHSVHRGAVWTSWAGFTYLGVVSMYLGFFAWYTGLAIGGVARVSQIQLLQPVLSLCWAAIFLHEHVDLLLAVVALVVLVSVFGSRRSAITFALPKEAANATAAQVTTAGTNDGAKAQRASTSSR